MNKNFKTFPGWVSIGKGAVVAVALTASVIKTEAQDYNLSARNTSLQIDVGGSTPGLSSWIVNGANTMEQQWFYYSIGSGPVYSIDTIAPWSNPSITGSANFPVFTEGYTNSATSLQTKYTLTSSPVGSGTATLTTLVNVLNTSGADETFHLYQYSDFLLGGNGTGQNIQFTAPAGSSYQANQANVNGASVQGKFTVLPSGSTVEEVAGLVDGTQFGLGNGNTAPAFNNSTLSAVGDVQYAYEIDVPLASGSGFQISELQTVVPEPSPLALILSGMVAVALCSRRGFPFYKNVTGKD